MTMSTKPTSSTRATRAQRKSSTRLLQHPMTPPQRPRRRSGPPPRRAPRRRRRLGKKPVPPQPPSEKRRADVNAGRIAGVFGLRGELKLDASRIGEDALRDGLVATLQLPDGTARAVTIA